MNEYWQHQHGMTPDEKRAFVERTLADQADFLHSLRTIHSAAENRMLTRVARGGEDDEDGDDASVTAVAKSRSQRLTRRGEKLTCSQPAVCFTFEQHEGTDMEKSRIVCWFSCGAASAVATKLAIKQNNNGRELVVARCILKEEHQDNDRFANQCAEWFGQPIVNLINADFEGSIYNVIQKRKYISGIKGAPCTYELKKRVREQFQLATDTHVFGYCAEEADRYDRFLDANNIHATVPLIDRGLSHGDTLAMVKDAGIDLPVMYRLGYQHNNCIGCVKSTGQGYWNKIRQDFPDQFSRMAEKSRALGVRMIESGNTRIFLDELKPGTGCYQDEPEIQCGIFCEMAKADMV